MSESVTLYEGEQKKGNIETLTEECSDLKYKKLTSGASSIIVSSGKWDVFTEVGFGLPMNTLLEGRVYCSPTDMGLLKPIMSLRPTPKNTSDSVILYGEEQFGGHAETLKEKCIDLKNKNLPSGASSINVSETSGKWDVFTKPGYGLPMTTLLEGRVYRCPADMGLQSPIMSLRPTPK